MLTWFLNFGDGSVIVALAKALLISAMLIIAVLGAAWLGTAFFAAIGAAIAKSVFVSGVMAGLCKLPNMLSILM